MRTVGERLKKELPLCFGFTQLSGSTLVSPGGCSSFSFLKMDGTPFQTHEHQEKCLGGSIMIEHSEDVFR